MKKLHFKFSIEVEEKTGTILAAYFQVREGRAAKVKEFAEGNAFANYSATGELLGIEILGPCEISVLDRIAPREPKVRNFVRKSLPPALAVN